MSFERAFRPLNRPPENRLKPWLGVFGVFALLASLHAEPGPNFSNECLMPLASGAAQGSVLTIVGKSANHGCKTDSSRSAVSDGGGRRFLGWTTFEDWERRDDPSSAWIELDVSPGFVWHELIMSWNAVTPEGTGLEFEAAPIAQSRALSWYVLGKWTASDTEKFRRESVRGQRDEHGEVRTDTLVLSKPATNVRLRVRFVSDMGGPSPRLNFLGACFLNREIKSSGLPPNRAAWGRLLDVPKRTQADYPEGINEWCSPTSLSMVLSWWGEALDRDELVLDVREVARGVHDPAWPGTGNWPFNTAFAGGFEGIRAYVSRFADVAEIEDWIVAGVPVIVSLDYDRLRRKDDVGGSGHLVVVAGFSDRGDVIINDPGSRRFMRHTYRRSDFVAAWNHSRRTVYLVYSENLTTPVDRLGHWLRGR